MRRLLAALVLCLTPAATMADDCTATIAALFTGGPLDPLQRGPRIETTVTVKPDGTVTPLMEVRWETMTRAVTAMGPTFIIMDGDRTWTATGADGPRTQQPSSIPPDVEARAREQADQMARNLTETACLG